MNDNNVKQICIPKCEHPVTNDLVFITTEVVIVAKNGQVIKKYYKNVPYLRIKDDISKNDYEECWRVVDDKLRKNIPGRKIKQRKWINRSRDFNAFIRHCVFGQSYEEILQMNNGFVPIRFIKNVFGEKDCSWQQYFDFVNNKYPRLKINMANNIVRIKGKKGMAILGWFKEWEKYRNNGYSFGNDVDTVKKAIKRTKRVYETFP